MPEAVLVGFHIVKSTPPGMRLAIPMARREKAQLRVFGSLLPLLRWGVILPVSGIFHARPLLFNNRPFSKGCPNIGQLGLPYRGRNLYREFVAVVTSA